MTNFDIFIRSALYGGGFLFGIVAVLGTLYVLLFVLGLIGGILSALTGNKKL